MILILLYICIAFIIGTIITFICWKFFGKGIYEHHILGPFLLFASMASVFAVVGLSLAYSDQLDNQEIIDDLQGQGFKVLDIHWNEAEGNAVTIKIQDTEYLCAIDQIRGTWSIPNKADCQMSNPPDNREPVEPGDFK